MKKRWLRRDTALDVALCYYFSWSVQIQNTKFYSWFYLAVPCPNFRGHLGSKGWAHNSHKHQHLQRQVYKLKFALTFLKTCLRSPRADSLIKREIQGPLSLEELLTPENQSAYRRRVNLSMSLSVTLHSNARIDLHPESRILKLKLIFLTLCHCT